MAAQEVSPSSTAVDAEHPWPGLYAYTEEQAAFFHGRETETDELLRRVRQKTLTLLFGQSGLGKSSLLNASLFPRMREAGLHPISIRFVLGEKLPSPSEQTSAALAPATFASARFLWDTAEQEETSTPGGQAQGQAQVPVLVFDQFEELFTRGQETTKSREQVTAFLRRLAAVVEHRTPDEATRGPRLHVLLAMREDYLAHLESWRSEMPSLLENRMRITALDGHGALRAVTRPAALRPGQPTLVTPSVSRQVVRFLATGRSEQTTGKEDLGELTIDPALLSLVLRELNSRRVQRGLAQITPELLQETGEVNGILREFYRRVVAEEHPSVRQLLEDQLLTDTGYRDNVSIGRAERFLREKGGDVGAVERLVQRRLLRIEERLEQRRVELAHDVLCRVLMEARETRQQEERAREAESLARAAEARLEEQNRQLRKARLLFGSIGLAGAAVLVAGGLGLSAAHNLREARRLAEAREKAEGLITFMQGDLHEKLKPLGKVSLLAEVTDRINRYYDSALLDDGRTAHNLAAKSRALAQQGDTEVTRGQVDKALQDYRAAQKMAEEAGTLEPNNPQHALAVANCLRLIGDASQKQNQPAIALPAFTQSREIFERLSLANPGATALRKELAISYERIGDFVFWKKDFKEALKIFLQEKQIFEALLAREPGQREWQFGIGKCIYRVGLVKRGEKNKEGALAEYLQSYTVFKELTDADPDNAEWQKELARSTTRIGGVFQDLGDNHQALEKFRDAAAIYKRIASLDPTNAEWQRDLATAYAFLGSKQEKPEEALQTYELSLRIREKLAAIDANNLNASRDLALGIRNIGLIHEDQKDYGKALERFRKSLEIFERVAAKDPGNSDWQNNIARTLLLIAQSQLEGTPPAPEEAVKSVQRGLAILADLEKRSPLTEDYAETRKELQAMEAKLAGPATPNQAPLEGVPK